MTKCLYCGRVIPDESVLTVCDICGEKVWGKKMFAAIKRNMETAKKEGNLCHTSPPFEEAPTRKKIGF
jgi:hypothetical protein